MWSRDENVPDHDKVEDLQPHAVWKAYTVFFSHRELYEFLFHYKVTEYKDIKI